MKLNSTLRQEAKASLTGKWNTSALAVFVYLVITLAVTGILSFIPYAGSIAGGFLIAPLGYGIIIMFLMQFRGQEMQLNTLFNNFNQRIWCTKILQFVYTYLWTLLLIIPGIIKSYSYAMTDYILLDHPELSNNEAIEASMAMMQGNKWRLFCLDFSFIGWALLSVLTLGIGFFWLAPYMYSAHAAFYEDLKAQAVAEA